MFHTIRRLKTNAAIASSVRQADSRRIVIVHSTMQLAYIPVCQWIESDQAYRRMELMISHRYTLRDLILFGGRRGGMTDLE